MSTERPRLGVLARGPEDDEKDEEEDGEEDDASACEASAIEPVESNRRWLGA